MNLIVVMTIFYSRQCDYTLALGFHGQLWKAICHLPDYLGHLLCFPVRGAVTSPEPSSRNGLQQSSNRLPSPQLLFWEEKHIKLI